MTYLDTNVLVKLDARDTKWFSASAKRVLDRGDLLVSAIAVLELEMLHEIGRLKPSALKLVEGLAGDFGLRVCDLSLRR